MNISLYENASALNGLQQHQNIIANNIAASHVSGYKKIAVAFEAIEGGEIARSTHGRLHNSMPGSFPVLNNQVDFNEGELKETSNPLDMAIRGNGFFGLSINDGNIVYTRDGQFYVNSDGVLVNSMGHEFVDETGGVIETIPGEGAIHIDKEGQLFQGDELVSKLGVFVFEDPLSDLKKVGGGFVSNEDAQPRLGEPQDFTILQGFLESSNVSSVEEMIGLIEVSRAHEANVKMIQVFDENIGKAIGTLGATQ